MLGHPLAFLYLGRPADLLALELEGLRGKVLLNLPLKILQQTIPGFSLPLLVGFALLDPLLLAYLLTAAFASRHPDIMANIVGFVSRCVANSFSHILANLLRNGVALFRRGFALFLSLVHHLSDGIARLVSADRLKFSSADFLGFVHVVAFVFAYVLPHRVAHVRSGSF